MNIKFFSDLRAPCPGFVDAEVERILVEILILYLLPQEKLIVLPYYGIGMEPVTRVALAERLKLSYETVGKIRDRAMAKLRQPACREPLLSAINEYVSSFGTSEG